MAWSEVHARDSHHTQHHTELTKCRRQPQRDGPAFKGTASELPRGHAQSINPLIAPEVPARPMAHFGKLLLGGCEQRPSKRAKPPRPAARPPGLVRFALSSQVGPPVPLPGRIIGSFPFLTLWKISPPALLTMNRLCNILCARVPPPRNTRQRVHSLPACCPPGQTHARTSRRGLCGQAKAPAPRQLRRLRAYWPPCAGGRPPRTASPFSLPLCLPACLGAAALGLANLTAAVLLLLYPAVPASCWLHLPHRGCSPPAARRRAAARDRPARRAARPPAAQQRDGTAT